MAVPCWLKSELSLKIIQKNNKSGNKGIRLYLKIGGVFWTKFELSLNKIQNNDVRFRPPTLRFGRTKTEKFSLHFLIFSCAIFSFKRKRKFFCFVFPLRRELRKRSILIRKRAKIFTPYQALLWYSGRSPRPPSFLPFCFSGFARLEAFFSPVLFFVPTKLARRF